ncbi:50S ribosomal protein L24e [Candidatus Pacearchaeota archaeon]|nr:50S ribosomal protein L24e [Candidatus Pacearchaeota archaeon]
MPKCVYCGNNYEFPRGVTIVTNKGKANYLCSGKCRKNMAMHRRKVRWISKQKVSEENTENKS